MSEKRYKFGIIKGSRQAHIIDCHTCKSATIDVYDDNIKYFVDKLNELSEENEQLKQELRGMNELLKSYRETIKHDAELLADATRKGYLPPLEDL